MTYRIIAAQEARPRRIAAVIDRAGARLIFFLAIILAGMDASVLAFDFPEPVKSQQGSGPVIRMGTSPASGYTISPSPQSTSATSSTSGAPAAPVTRPTPTSRNPVVKSPSLPQNQAGHSPTSPLTSPRPQVTQPPVSHPQLESTPWFAQSRLDPLNKFPPISGLVILQERAPVYLVNREGKRRPLVMIRGTFKRPGWSLYFNNTPVVSPFTDSETSEVSLNIPLYLNEQVNEILVIAKDQASPSEGQKLLIVSTDLHDFAFERREKVRKDDAEIFKDIPGLTVPPARFLPGYPKYSFNLDYVPSYFGMEQKLMSGSAVADAFSISGFQLQQVGARLSLALAPAWSLDLMGNFSIYNVPPVTLTNYSITASKAQIFSVSLTPTYCFTSWNRYRSCVSLGLGVDGFPYLNFTDNVTLSMASISSAVLQARFYQKFLLNRVPLGLELGYNRGLSSPPQTGIVSQGFGKVFANFGVELPLSSRSSIQGGLQFQSRSSTFVHDGQDTWSDSCIDLALMIGYRFVYSSNVEKAGNSK